jgi:outer membrane lipoprotein-sorting protein
MEKIKIILLIVFLVALLMILNGCNKVYVQDGEHQLVMNGNGMVETEDFKELLSRAQKVSNISYEVKIVEPDGKTIPQQFWLKDKKMRFKTIVDSKETISIFDQDNNVIYIYTPSENKALKMSLHLGQDTEKSIIDTAVDLENYQPEIIGNETIDNKNCLIIQYKFGGYLTKEWLWKKYGLPVKIESETPDGKVITSYENFNFSPIADNMFELPGGIEITDLSASLPDINNLNLENIKQ